MLDVEKTKIEKIAGIGSKMAKRLKKLGIQTVLDFFYYFPIRYDDFSKVVSIAELKPYQTYCIKARILDIQNQRSPKKGMILTTALLSDKTGSVRAVWYNQPFLTGVLRKGEEFLFAGKTEYGPFGFFLQNPAYEKAESEAIHTARLVPVYSETEGISSKWLRKKIYSLLPVAEAISDYLPEEVKNSQNLINLNEALSKIHFPRSHQELEEARRRLAFDELFLLQLKMLKIKKEWQKHKAPLINVDVNLIRSLVLKLPFKLTNAQRKAAWEILQDLQKDRPMNRLLEGDVGSGKTVVAAIAMLAVAKSNHQSAFMAPTEILAIQHYQTLTHLLIDYDISIALLTSGKSELNHKKEKRGELIKKIAKKEVDIVVGTHSLIQSNVKFARLGLAIIDEQHRFGVRQRALLRERGNKANKEVPHLLSMSATPIPRTLSFVLYGDLDLSILDEMPKGRQKVSTHLIPPQKRPDAYQFIENEIKKGRQIFVICPLIEESDKLGVKSAEVEYKKLKEEIFPEFKIGLLHGKMKTKEKEKIMEDFKNKKYDILVSTAVVEVGVDVPNASVMMIEGAERFGLAQLHQFRGRVGRAEHKSYCFLFTETGSQKTLKRLYSLIHLDDGFKLAEKDLELRGPGEFYGTKQHGFLDLKLASLFDKQMILQAKKEAERIIEAGLENYPALGEKIMTSGKLD